MTSVEINYLAVFVSAVIIFLLGGLWYSPVLFAKQWMSAINKTDEEIKKTAKPTNYMVAFMQGLISAYILSIFISWAQAATPEKRCVDRVYVLVWVCSFSNYST